MIFQNHSIQQCFAVPEFFSSWSRCFDRSSVIHSSTMGLQVVDTSKTEKEMGWSHHCDDFGEHQYDRELSSSLLWHLVADTVDRLDLGTIKGGFFSFA